MIVPMPFSGTVLDFRTNPNLHIGYEWINTLSNKKIYLSLFRRWVNDDLPLGYDIYLVSFHLEAVDVQWVERQSKFINGEMIVLFDGVSNNLTIPKVRFLSYYYWHIQLDTMIKWFGHGNIESKNITHKASAFCNRITSTKLITFTTLMELFGKDNCMLVLHDWLERENLYAENEYVPNELMEIVDLFFKKYYKKEFKIDDFSNKLNYQKHTANPWQPSYQNCALHFTNESFNTSALYDSALYSHPGPFITEKTLKCLLGGTAFVPIGQFDTYGALRRLGFEFNYNFDTTFDNISDDHSRVIAIIGVIKSLIGVDKNDIYSNSKESSTNNYYYITSGEFYKHCEMLNEHTVEQVMEHIDLVTG
jgi:hypothetical protein